MIIIWNAHVVRQLVVLRALCQQGRATIALDRRGDAEAARAAADCLARATGLLSEVATAAAAATTARRASSASATSAAARSTFDAAARALEEAEAAVAMENDSKYRRLCASLFGAAIAPAERTGRRHAAAHGGDGDGVGNDGDGGTARATPAPRLAPTLTPVFPVIPGDGADSGPLRLILKYWWGGG